MADLPLDSAAIDVELLEARLYGVALGPSVVKVDWGRPSLSGAVTTTLGRLRVTGQVQGLLDHGLRWHVDGLDLRPVRAWAGLAPVEGTGEVHVTSSGPLLQPRLEAQADLHGLRLGGLALARLRAGGSIDTAGAFTVSVTDGGPRQHLLASGNLSRRVLHLATLSIGGTDLSHYLAGANRQLWSGRLTASLDLQGDLDQPQATGTFRLDNVGLRGQELGDIQWQVRLADGQAQLGVAALDSTVRLQGSIDLETTGLPVRMQGGILDAQLRPFLALLTNEPLGYQGTLRARLRLQGLLLDPRRFDADIGLQALQVTTPKGQLVLQRPGLATLRHGVVRLAQLDLEGSAGSMQVEGSVASDGPLDLHYQLDDLGLDFLEPFIQQRAIGLAGRLQGRLDLLGSSRDPRITGKIAITDMGAMGLRFGDMQGQVTYGRGAIHLQHLELLLPAGGRLHGQAKGPMRLPVADLHTSARRVDYEAMLELVDVVLDDGQGLSDSVRAMIAGSVQLAGRSLDLQDLTGRLHLTRLELARGP